MSIVTKFDFLLRKLRVSDVDQNNKGGFVNEAAIVAAYPTGQEGWFLLNYETDTFWIWDAETSAWVDSDRKGQVSSVAGKTGAVTLDKSDVGLNNVDNTSDADKPISTAVGLALGNKLESVSVSESLSGNGTAGNPLTVRSFSSDITSSDIAGVATWADNVLTIKHDLNRLNVSLDIKDGNGENLTYSFTVVDVNNITIYFPVSVVPISGTYKVRIN